MIISLFIASSLLSLVGAQSYGQYYAQNSAFYFPYARTYTYQPAYQTQQTYTSYNSFPPPYAGYYFGAYNRRDPFFYTQNYYPSYINNNYPDQYNFVGEALPGGWTKLANGDIVTGNKLAALYLICEGRSCQG